MKSPDSIVTLSRNNSQKSRYLYSSSVILVIALLLISTPILTSFVSSSYSSLVFDGHDNKDSNYLKKTKESGISTISETTKFEGYLSSPPPSPPSPPTSTTNLNVNNNDYLYNKHSDNNQQIVPFVYAQEESSKNSNIFEFLSSNILGFNRLSSPSSSLSSPSSSLSSPSSSSSSPSSSPLSSLSSDTDRINITSLSSSPFPSTSSTESLTTTTSSLPTQSIDSASSPSSSSQSPLPSTNKLTYSYFANKENVQYHSHYPLKDKDTTKDKQIKECIDCFISELKKIDNKMLADKILKDIEKEFGSLLKLCKLIDNGDINRDQLEHILYSILFGNKDKDKKDNQHHNYKFIDAKIKNEFIQTVVECLFQEPIIYVVWPDTNPDTFDIFFSFRYRQWSIVQPTKEH